FKAFNEWIGTYAQEITANYLNYLKVFAVALVVLALFSTVLHIISSAIIVPIFSRNADAGTCKALDGFISPEKTITLKALKEYLKNARE
ncbi:hypothetical protein ACE40V_24200, partial [Salmonella enterica]|uniref:hypothetical protein n=1 Tax=Salmonella enterica TaxID=28901 RepID=UPI003D2CCDBA